MNQPSIFLSHSSADKALVKVLVEKLEQALGIEGSVFASTRPSSIPSGTEWMQKVIENLDKADVFIILITKPSENSVWVGFELGYFWHKSQKQQIYALSHPNATVPSPLNTLQAKSVIDEQEVHNFFEALCIYFEKEFHDNDMVGKIVEVANSLSVEHPERSIGRFESMLATSSWSKKMINDKQIWVCNEDAFFQIIVENENIRDFQEPWIQTLPFPDKTAHFYLVILNIGGLPIEQLNFISLDGDRYFVPMPLRRWDKLPNKYQYYFVRDSLEMKVHKVIGSNTIMLQSFEEFFHQNGIEILGSDEFLD